VPISTVDYVRCFGCGNTRGSIIQLNKNNMITVGLDLSLVKTGYAIIKDDGTVLASGIIKSKPTGDLPIDETMRIKKIAEDILEKIDEILPKDEPTLVVIEGMAFMAQGTSLVQLAALNYLTRILLAEFEWPFLIVAPTSLKKFITGSGKGDKDMMLMSVYKNYGFEAMDNNEADGYSLAACGLAVLDKPLIKMGVPQQEVIKLLKKQL
jgi:crossover junction endodeoxyribonuclease RuvC